jgi:tripartite-type tricarboxylate transporter receptor subunit TctC
MACCPRVARVAGALLVLASCLAAAAEPPYPTRPIRLIIPYPAGGPRDIQARLISNRLTELWGRTVIIDNRAGASGLLGTDLAAKAAPDGYTLLMIGGGHAINATLQPRLPYDSIKDFAPIARTGSAPGLMVVGTSLPVKSVTELVDYMRQRPGKLFYASAGTGTPNHLAMELLKIMTRTDAVHVPYKGMAPGLTDVMSGQVQISIPSIPGAVQLARAGKLRALAVTGVRRSPAAPEIPTVSEAGIPGYSSTNWYGFVAPAKTPSHIITLLSTEIVRLVDSPGMRDRLQDIGLEPDPAGPAQFAEFIRTEIVKWGKVVRAVGLKPE